MKRAEIQAFLRNTRSNIIHCLGTYFQIFVEYDKKAYPKMKSNARIYLQVEYSAVCTKTGKFSSHWRGRKWYLSDHMTEDEIIKTAFAAFKMAVEHEVLESFKVNGVALFNPHVDYKALRSISHLEVTREEKKNERKSSVAKLPGRKQRQSVSGGHRAHK